MAQDSVTPGSTATQEVAQPHQPQSSEASESQLPTIKGGLGKLPTFHNFNKTFMCLVSDLARTKTRQPKLI